MIQVDYACTPEEVQQHFQSCGTVNRVTILTDKFGQPKGFAYVEFVEVSAKRTNVPGLKQYFGRRPAGFRARRPFMPSPFYPPYAYG
ncbi:polyadenylate-binding protein 1, partial [Trifolium medium]|nr:polyadenylate-binding protein 1 [Trifolium medium]